MADKPKTEKTLRKTQARVRTPAKTSDTFPRSANTDLASMPSAPQREIDQEYTPPTHTPGS